MRLMVKKRNLMNFKLNAGLTQLNATAWTAAVSGLLLAGVAQNVRAEETEAGQVSPAPTVLPPSVGA